MICLNVGNLWTNQYLDKVIDLNRQHKDDNIQVKALYGSIADLTPTARSMDRLPFLEWSDIINYVQKATENDIAIRYTLNASCLGAIQDFKRDWDNRLKGCLERLHEVGVREWTVTSPLLISELHKMFPEDFIEVSTIAEVDTPADARLWRNLGARGVNIATKINRDFGAIRRIAATNMRVTILANEACLYRCLYRRDCYNMSSHNSLRSPHLFDQYPFRWCNNIRMWDLAEWLKACMVLPQWMKIYEEQVRVNWFKIAFRTHPYEVAVPILELYMNQYHGGNYLDLWPTIRKLGGTEEPADKQFISCKRLDELDFLGYFLDRSYKCDYLCRGPCAYCDRIALEASHV